MFFNDLENDGDVDPNPTINLNEYESEVDPTSSNYPLTMMV
jgi:hypothetical protein